MSVNECDKCGVELRLDGGAICFDCALWIEEENAIQAARNAEWWLEQGPEDVT